MASIVLAGILVALYVALLVGGLVFLHRHEWCATHHSFERRDDPCVPIPPHWR